MKAIMDQHGTITLKAETTLESFALWKWADMASIKVNDLARGETHHFRGSALIIDGSVENKQEVLL